MMHLANIICPMPHSEWQILRAWCGYSFLIETMHRLWNTPSMGRFMSTISGKVICRSGRNSRSVALPSQASSCGGGPTTVVA